jgi:drug/metabolite transporter (DMT)-like permease
VADFGGGLLSRRFALLAVLVISQAAGLTGVALVVALGGHAAPGLGELWPAAAGGVSGALALAAFYRGLAIGTMSIVAPISATGAAVPVFVGLATGERPGVVVLAGIVLAVVGVVLASREEAPEGSPAATVARRSLLLALVAALGFGGFFVGMDAAADADVFWALLAARIASFSMLGAAFAIVRPQVPREPAGLGLLAGIGVLDLAANACFAAGSTEGLLSVVAVLASLYPVVTVLLARAVLGERVRRDQEVGIAAAIAGVALIASG